MQLLKYAQYLHPEKRNSTGATSGISNLALSVCHTLKNSLEHVFSAITTEDVVDKVRSQWLMYQNEELKEEWYKNLEDKLSVKKPSTSYWKNLEHEYGLDSQNSSSIYFRRIDTFWKHIGNLRDTNRSFKYPQLFSLVKCILSLSHGNSTPERGFSINKLLDAHGYTIYEDTIVGLRTVKDELNRVGDVLKFNIDRDLIREVKSSYTKYESDRATRKALAEAEEAERKKRESNVTHQLQIQQEIDTINLEIEKCKSNLKGAPLQMI